MRREDKLLSVKEIVYASEAMKSLLGEIKSVSKSNNPILLLGESGVGKSLLATRIYEESDMLDKPFVSVNCSAMQESVLEAELFGYKKGAFSGAYNDKKGLIQQAHGGTLFLDEIGSLSLRTQSKLLSFLQEGEVYRLGENTPVYADVRLICATNKDLLKEIEAKSFRSDLFYRINVVTLTVPPLRSRPEDIPVLAQSFLKQIHLKEQALRASDAPDAGPVHFSEEVLQSLATHKWPGNVRELENRCEHLYALAESSVINLKDLPAALIELEGTESGFKMEYSPDHSLYEVEKAYTLLAMNYFNGNKARVAKALGISNKTLYNKLHEYGVFEKFSHHRK